MNIAQFDYDLPQELIAQVPSRNRDESRLMVIDRETERIISTQFKAIVDYLKPNDCLIVNNTKVFKARLYGNRESGAEVEIFLIRPQGENQLLWEAYAQPSKRLNKGEEIFFHKQQQPENLSVLLGEYLGYGRWSVRFQSETSKEAIIEQYGHIPLPLYIKRADTPADLSRYQTIFAKDDLVGAVAAPTAGFHFTPEIMASLSTKGIKKGEVTLHVGPGTFKPVNVEEIEHHIVDAEYAILPENTVKCINETRQAGGSIIAVGTTSCRTLESAEVSEAGLIPFARMVDLYIKPGFTFNTVDHLLTNFHLPKSSLLILIAAFAGRELVMEAYQQAIKEKYRFYSYGDAMLIL